MLDLLLWVRCAGRACSRQDERRSVRGGGRRVLGSGRAVPVSLVSTHRIGSRVGARKAKKQAEAQAREERSYVENGQRLSLAGFGVLFAQRNQLLGQPLGFLGFWPGGGYGFVFEERGDEVSEQGLPVRAAARQVSVFLESARHFFCPSLSTWVALGRRVEDRSGGCERPRKRRSSRR